MDVTKIKTDRARDSLNYISKPDYLGWVIIGLLALGFALLIYLCVSKGRLRRIVIVKVRDTVRDLYTDSGAGRYEYHHYTVDFRYEGKNHIHTKNLCCYEELEVGQTYTARIRLSDITEIIGNDKGANDEP